MFTDSPLWLLRCIGEGGLIGFKINFYLISMLYAKIFRFGVRNQHPAQACRGVDGISFREANPDLGRSIQDVEG